MRTENFMFFSTTGIFHSTMGVVHKFWCCRSIHLLEFYTFQQFCFLFLFLHNLCFYFLFALFIHVCLQIPKVRVISSCHGSQIFSRYYYCYRFRNNECEYLIRANGSSLLQTDSTTPLWTPPPMYHMYIVVLLSSKLPLYLTMAMYPNGNYYIWFNNRKCHARWNVHTHNLKWKSNK